MEKKPINLQELDARIKDKEINALRSFIDDLSGDFTPSIAKIPEPVFVDYFLDHFKALASNGEVDSALTASWVGLVGSPYLEAEIVDSKGDTLYKVPPLMARPNVNKKLQNISFNEIGGKYNAEKNRLESAGERYLHGALNGVSSMVTPEKDSVETNALAWSNVLKRYDTPVVEEVSDTKETKKKPKELDDNLEIDYE